MTGTSEKTERLFKGNHQQGVHLRFFESLPPDPHLAVSARKPWTVVSLFLPNPGHPSLTHLSPHSEELAVKQTSKFSTNIDLSSPLRDTAKALRSGIVP